MGRSWASSQLKTGGGLLASAWVQLRTHFPDTFWRWRHDCSLKDMKERGLTFPEIGLIAGTRVALGIGTGLLLSNRFNKDQRNAAGWALVGVGILTTIPIALGVLGKCTVADKPVALAA
jgi:hypothetical protein